MILPTKNDGGPILEPIACDIVRLRAYLWYDQIIYCSQYRVFSGGSIRTMNSNDKAFTLIELLIVVAIIGILAAIAIPNFLEAQTRAKVTRAQAEIRNLSMVLEAYCVDEDAYILSICPFAVIQGVNASGTWGSGTAV